MRHVSIVVAIKFRIFGKTLAELLARVIASRVPDHDTVERVRAQRGGRVTTPRAEAP